MKVEPISNTLIWTFSKDLILGLLKTRYKRMRTRNKLSCHYIAAKSSEWMGLYGGILKVGNHRQYKLEYPCLNS